MINHQINGYLAKRFDTSDLAAGINWVLSDENRHKDLCLKARLFFTHGSIDEPIGFGDQPTIYSERLLHPCGKIH